MYIVLYIYIYITECAISSGGKIDRSTDRSITHSAVVMTSVMFQMRYALYFPTAPTSLSHSGIESSWKPIRLERAQYVQYR